MNFNRQKEMLMTLKKSWARYLMLQDLPSVDSSKQKPGLRALKMIFKMLRMRRIKQKKNWMTLEILQVAQETVLQSQKGLLLLLLGLF